MQSGGPNRERYTGRAAGGPDRRAAGGSDGRADRARAELNGNPVQSGGLNRESLCQGYVCSRGNIVSLKFQYEEIFKFLS